MTSAFTPYSTAAPMFGTRPSWIPDELDQQRILSYQLYEEIYWNVPDTFTLVQRGTNDKPIYIPSAKTIVNTMDRFTAPQFSVLCEPKTPNGSRDAPAVVAANLAMGDFFKREAFNSKFDSARLYNLIRGDWVWHLIGNQAKPQGSRITIQDIDPASYFPITDENDVDKILGAHLVEQITVGTDVRIRRITYRKVPKSDGTNTITVEEGIFPTDKWGGPKDKPLKVIRPPTPLPPEITQLPVYHIKNFREGQNPFGSSELRGLERVIAGINQGISDQDLALALNGLGLYITDADPPKDEKTKETLPWFLGPGRVVEIAPGRNFNRIDGVRTITPSLDHLNWMWSRMKESASTPDIAVGTVDVNIAQSGIALALQLSPIIAAASKKNNLILDVHAQMFYDLVNGWYPAYEQTSFPDVMATPMIGDAVPTDRAGRLKELNDMLDRKVISAAYYRQEATKLGYVFPDDMDTQITSETSSLAEAQDPFGARTSAELNAGGA